MKKIFLTTIALFFVYPSIACTTAVISGKHTKDGRPIIWKLRDTDFMENKMMYFDDGIYKYVGLINSIDSTGKQIWGGANSMGFAIMNSASFNVNLKDTTSFKDQEGEFMKQALQECSTLAEFEKLIQNRPKPMGLAAHFGVIDAQGGAAFYEVNHYSFTKFDANDPTQAPQGYILRTNYSFTGKKDVGYGFIRYQTAQDLFYQADATGNLNYQTIIQKFSRSFKHSILDKDFRSEYEAIPEGEYFINSSDFITRNGSASAILVHGAKTDEPNDLATIWTMVGFPNTCIALPLWVKGANTFPNILKAEGASNCFLNQITLDLKQECYPIKRSSGYKYLQISKLLNLEKTGIVQKLESAEKEIFSKTEENLSKWRKNNTSKAEITSFYNWLNTYVEEFYAKELK